MRPPFISALLLCFLTACGGSDPRCASLPGGEQYCLQPSSAVAPFNVTQKIDAMVGGRRESMIVEIEVDKQAMHVVALTPFGQTLIQASYDNHEARAGRWPDARLKPAQFLALLQIALWPSEAVRAGLDPSLVLDEAAGQRRVLQNGELLLEVGYTGARPPAGDMRIVLPTMTMQYDITTLDQPIAP